MTTTETKLETMDDLQAFLKASGCRMTVGAAEGGWCAVIYRGNAVVARSAHEDFAHAVRQTCASAYAALRKQEMHLN